MTAQEREELFWEKVRPEGDCLIWTAGRRDSGKRYGVFWDGRRMVAAHRYAYERAVGEVPEGMELHHTCENKLCVNTNHLALLTRYGHMQLHRPTHCRKGHLFTPETTYWVTDARWRECRICKRERKRRFNERRKAVA